MAARASASAAMQHALVAFLVPGLGGAMIREVRIDPDVETLKDAIEAEARGLLGRFGKGPIRYYLMGQSGDKSAGEVAE